MGDPAVFTHYSKFIVTIQRRAVPSVVEGLRLKAPTLGSPSYDGTD